MTQVSDYELVSLLEQRRTFMIKKISTSPLNLPSLNAKSISFNIENALGMPVLFENISLEIELKKNVSRKK